MFTRNCFLNYENKIKNKISSRCKIVKFEFNNFLILDNLNTIYTIDLTVTWSLTLPERILGRDALNQNYMYMVA